MEQMEGDSTDYFKLETHEEKIREALLKYLKGETKLLPDNLFNGSENLTDIDFSGCQITELKPNLFHGLTTISKINFSNNKIKTVPQDFFNGLEEINQINFSNNQIQEIPSTLFNGLKNVDRVNFSKNKINKLPEQLTNWNNQKDEYDLEAIAGINFSYNEITTIPSSLFNGIVSIHGINFSFNKISDIPQDLFEKVDSLWDMNLSNNRIQSVPEKLFLHVKNAKGINFADNYIKYLSMDLINHIDLINDINFSNNYISSLSLSILNKSNLYVDFRNNFKINNTSFLFDTLFCLVSTKQDSQEKVIKRNDDLIQLKENLLVIYLNKKFNKIDDFKNDFNDKIERLEKGSWTILDFLVSLNDLNNIALIFLESYISNMLKENEFLKNDEFKLSSSISIRNLCKRNSVELFKIFLPLRSIGDANDPAYFNKYVKHKEKFYFEIIFSECMDIAIENKNEDIAVYLIRIINQIISTESAKILDTDKKYYYFKIFKVKLLDDYFPKFFSPSFNWWNAIEAVLDVCKNKNSNFIYLVDDVSKPMVAAI